MAKERFDIWFDKRKLKQWILPIRMGGVRAADIAPVAFLANIIDTLPIIRSIFQNPGIEMADVPGTKECWHELHHTLNEDEPPLPEQVKEILKQAKLDQSNPATGPGDQHRRVPGDG